MRRQSVFGRERSGDVSARSLVSKHPKIEFGEKAGEVVERFLWLGECFHPEV